MKLKKVLSLILCIAMVLGTMGTVAFAEDTVATVDGVAYTDLNEAVADANAKSGEVNLTLLADVTGNVAIQEKVGLYLTIDGGDHTINGVIEIAPLSDTKDNRRTTIMNVNFVDTTDESVSFIKSVKTNHYPRITVEGCNFTSNGAGDDVAVRLKDADDAIIKDCVGSGLHSFLQNTAGWDLSIENVTVTDSKGGFALGTVQDVTVKGCTIDVTEQGIRMDAMYNNNAVIENNSVSAFIPVVVRYAEVDSNITFTGTNTMTASNTDDLWCAIGKDEYKENGQILTAPVGKISVELKDGGLDDSGVSGADSIKFYAAKIGNTYYVTLQDAINAAQEDDVIVLLADVEYIDVVSEQDKAASICVPAGKEFTLDLNGHVISGKNKTEGSFALMTISSGAVVTVDDTSDDASGKITYASTREKTNYNNEGYTIRNKGTLILENGTIENSTPLGDDGYEKCVTTAVDNRSLTGPIATFIMNGGTVVSNTYFAIRTSVDEANTSGSVSVELNGGTVYGLQICDWGSKDLDYDIIVGDNIVIERSNYPELETQAIRSALAAAATSKITIDISEDAQINGEIYGLKAKIGNEYYPNIAKAIDAAEEGNIITILAGTHNAFTVPADKNDLTFVGETDADGNNLVTIRTNEEDIATTATATTGIYVQAEKATFRNLNLASGSFIPLGTSGKEVWMASAIGSVNGSVGAGTSKLNDLTIENCNFKGNGADYAVWVRACDLTIKNSTIEGYTWGVETYATGADQAINIINTEMTNVGNAIHTVSTTAGSKVNVKDSAIDAEQIHVSGESTMTIEGSEIKNADVMTYGKLTLTITDSALYSSSFSTYNDNSSISISEVYANNVNEIAASEQLYNVDFVTYYPTFEDYINKTNLTDVPAATDTVYVKFEDVTAADAEGEKTYNINLVATDEEIINRLNSADLTFAFNAISGDVDYEIIASNSEVAINAVDNSKVRYEFHYNGKDNITTDSANIITIGQVKFTGYGNFNFTVDANATTNAAHATTIADNIVDTFTPNGDATSVAEGELVIDDNTITDITIAVPDRNLTITVDFPNAIVDNVIAYQDMKVVISGGDLAEDITVDLGSDAAETPIVIDGKVDAKYAAAMVDGSYVINVTDALTLNNAYTVTVTGAGYRTARYTVTMTEDKALRFWNNVMDEAQVVEIGKDSSAVNVTFLAGDIVKDNKINIYDLSAVVSYFGTETDTEAYDAYAKYDLNRDGVIDSKDVAYVLVSWNN